MPAPDSDNVVPEVFGDSALIWPVYNEASTKEDQTLVRNVTDDMNSLLVFAGLFSATVTAFLVESYQNLKPDPNETTHALLANVTTLLSSNALLLHHLIASQQSSDLLSGLEKNTSQNALHLLASLSVERRDQKSQNPFVPSNLDFLCNLLWFSSLLCCLGCALVACLAQAWARRYLQVTEAYASPAVRGRIRAYLYRGLHRFRLRAVVDFIPMLIHASMFQFIGGLVLFLFTVNQTLATGSLLTFVGLVSCYAYFTIVTLVCKDSPYHTPLSKWCWDISRFCRRDGDVQDMGPLVGVPISTTEVADIQKAATRRTTEREESDRAVMQATIRALDDDGLLLSFLEESAAKSQAKGSNVNQKHLTTLLDTTDLASRFIRIFSEYKNLLLEDQATRIVSCYFLAMKVKNLRKSEKVVEIKEDPLPRGHFDGEEYMGIVLAAFSDFLGMADHAYKQRATFSFPKMRQLLGSYAFENLWRSLLRLSRSAKVLHDAIIKIKTSRQQTYTPISGTYIPIPIPSTYPPPSTYPSIPATHPLRSGADINTANLLNLVKTLRKELIGAIEVQRSGQLDSMDKLYPGYIPYLYKAWESFQSLLDRTKAHLEHQATLPPFRMPDDSIETTISGYKDLLIHLHYLQLFALFHYNAGTKSDLDEWKDAQPVVRENAKEYSTFNLSHDSRKKLRTLLEMYCKLRLDWPERGCKFALDIKNRKPSLFERENLHIENASLLLLDCLNGWHDIKSTTDGLIAHIVADELPKENDDLPRRAGNDRKARDVRNFARGKVVRIAELLIEKAATTVSPTDAGSWVELRERYKDFLYCPSGVDVDE